jgi:hypothetical protein
MGSKLGIKEAELVDLEASECQFKFDIPRRPP